MHYSRIEAALNDLGLSPKYKSYTPLIILVDMAVYSGRALKCKSAYQSIGREMNLNPRALETRINRDIKKALREKTPLATEIFGSHTKATTNKTFILAVADYCTEGATWISET